MKKFFLGLILLVLLVIGGAMAYLNRFVPSSDDRKVLGYVTESKDVSWGAGIILRPVPLLEKFAPEHKEKLDFALTRVIKLVGWAPQDKTWWRENVAAFAIGKVGAKPVYIFSSLSGPEKIQSALLSGKLAKKNPDGTYTLIAPDDCTSVGPVKLTVVGNIIALHPAEVTFAPKSEAPHLRLIAGSLKPKPLAESLGDHPAIGMLQMTGALDVLQNVVLAGEVSEKAKAQLTLAFSFSDIAKGKELLKMLQEKAPAEIREVFKTKTSISGSDIALRLTTDDISGLIKNSTGGGEGEPNKKLVTAETLAKIDRDREQSKPVNYTETPGPQEIFGTCESKATAFSAEEGKLTGDVVRWARSRQNPQGSFLTVGLELCLNSGYVPVFKESGLLEVVISSPAPEHAVCGEELDAQGLIKATNLSRANGTVERTIGFGISDDQVRQLKEIKGSATINVPKKVKKLSIPFVSPYTFQQQLGSGKLHITSELDWRGVRIKVIPDGTVPMIIDVRGLNEKKVYLEASYSAGDIFSGMLEDLLGIEKPAGMSFSFGGKVAEIEVVYAEETTPKAVAFTIPWSLPSTGEIPALDPGTGILTAEGFPKLSEGDYDAQKIKGSISEREPTIPNALQAPGPFLIDLFAPTAFFKNDIRIFVHGDVKKALEALPPLDLQVSYAELSNGESNDAKPLPEVLEKDDFGREIRPWGHWKLDPKSSNGGYNEYTQYFFDDYLEGIAEDEGIHPTFVEGKLALKLPLSFEASPLIPLNILETTEFSGVTLMLNDVAPTSFTALMEVKEGKIPRLDLYGVTAEGKLIQLKKGQGQEEDMKMFAKYESEEKIKALRLVRYSDEERAFEFPFQFGKKKVIAKVDPKKKK